MKKLHIALMGGVIGLACVTLTAGSPSSSGSNLIAQETQKEDEKSFALRYFEQKIRLERDSKVMKTNWDNSMSEEDKAKAIAKIEQEYAQEKQQLEQKFEQEYASTKAIPQQEEAEKKAAEEKAQEDASSGTDESPLTSPAVENPSSEKVDADESPLTSPAVENPSSEKVDADESLF